MWFHLLLGAAYAFHVTLTWCALRNNQTDVVGQRYLFSSVIIFPGNILVLLLGIPLLAVKVDVATALGWWAAGTVEAVRRVAGMW